MDPDLKLQLINCKITIQRLKKYKLNNTHYINFSNYIEIQKILQTNQKVCPHLEIYDITLGMNQPGKLFKVNDHINRIGENPFIGHQIFFNIDFINIEKLYIQTPQGIITNSCGDVLSNSLPYPSSHLANIATMGHVLKYKIYGYLIHV